jgi:hypothetical protein
VSLHGALDMTFVSALDVDLEVTDRNPLHHSSLTGCGTPLPPGGECMLHARRRKESLLGVAGSFCLRSPSEPRLGYSVSCDHPLGPAETKVEVVDPPGYAHTLKETHLGHHATFRFELVRESS